MFVTCDLAPRLNNVELKLITLHAWSSGSGPNTLAIC